MWRMLTDRDGAKKVENNSQRRSAGERDRGWQQ